MSITVNDTKSMSDEELWRNRRDNVCLKSLVARMARIIATLPNQRSKEETDDLLQVAWASLCENSERFDSTKASFRTYFRAIYSHVLNSRLRTLYRRPEILASGNHKEFDNHRPPADEEANAPDRNIRNTEDHAPLRSCFSKLSEREQKAVRDFYGSVFADCDPSTDARDLASLERKLANRNTFESLRGEAGVREPDNAMRNVLFRAVNKLRKCMGVSLVPPKKSERPRISDE